MVDDPARAGGFNRDEGSPQWLPIYSDGKTARFVAWAEDLERPDDAWPAPRVVYLQHPSDPGTHSITR